MSINPADIRCVHPEHEQLLPRVTTTGQWLALRPLPALRSDLSMASFWLIKQFKGRLFTFYEEALLSSDRHLNVFQFLEFNIKILSSFLNSAMIFGIAYIERGK